MKKIFTFENIPFFILMLLMLVIFSTRTITPGDDEWFSAILNDAFNGNLNDYLIHRYTNWTGRIVIEFIMVPMFGYNLWFWRFLNTIMSFVLAYGVYKLIPYKYLNKITKNKRMLIKSIICISIFSINKDVFLTAISWITGSFNYLWPVACSLLVILPFKNALLNEKFNKKYYIILIFAAILGGNMEQASLVMLCFGLATNIYVFIRDKKIKLDLIIFNLFILINTAILFLAPGNYARSASEKLTWFGEWDMISFTTKLMMGTNLLLNQLFNKEVMLMLLLIFLINIVVWKKYKNILFKALSAIPMIIIIIKLIEKVCYIFNFNINLFLFNLLNVQNLNILNFNNIKIFLPTSILLCALLIVPILFLFVFDTLEMRYLSIILYVAAICSALSISVSPTIYVSGARVFFVADILLIVIITLILSEFFKRWNVNIYLILLFIILSINSFILYIRKIL
ncbi:DUF6056 family protein [Clostridium sp.]|uniref:DUF6056 family protein n=2 Tax=Clostridium TaxID=1485 RepID=UPI0025BF12AD|nr:DUF6056 family protein [Clostridium sp.]MCI9070308.1 hypothetical protein [Clostridium sp.]